MWFLSLTLVLCTSIAGTEAQGFFAPLKCVNQDSAVSCGIDFKDEADCLKRGCCHGTPKCTTSRKGECWYPLRSTSVPCTGPGVKVDKDQCKALHCCITDAPCFRGEPDSTQQIINCSIVGGSVLLLLLVIFILIKIRRGRAKQLADQEKKQNAQEKEVSDYIMNLLNEESEPEEEEVY